MSIILTSSQKEEIEEKFDTPTIPKAVYENLPLQLAKGCINFSSSREKDMFLTSALVLISGCLPKYYGLYDNRKIFFNMYAMIVAPPASGKGVLLHAQQYVEQIKMKMKNEYYEKLKIWKLSKNENNVKEKLSTTKVEIPEPVFSRLVVPANSSCAAFIHSLHNSNGSGIIYETEADSLANTLKQEWGNYTDILRKAFHHEPITYSRKEGTVEIDISEPKLSVLLSGTFNQVSAMGLASPTNGLQSRFVFYLFEAIPMFKKVSPKMSTNLNSILKELGGKQMGIYSFLTIMEEVEFTLTDKQWTFLERWYEKKMKSITIKYNHYAGSMVTRLALTTFRLAGILSILKEFETGIVVDTVECEYSTDMLPALHE
ncbi:MAG: DUF3987 domain-containing protein [Sediminibacterium sp.]|nr:DUF3987 domain-containing protein [Sediminibacterium sp.]MDP3127929.1 DUF3987 domain-containing protein [Sediminibacterium sp.]